MLECENLRVLLPATALSYVEVQFVPVEAIHFLLGVNGSFQRVEKYVSRALSFPLSLSFSLPEHTRLLPVPLPTLSRTYPFSLALDL